MSGSLRLAALSPIALKGGLIVLAAALLLCVLAVLPYVWHGHLLGQAAVQTAELDLLKAKVQARASARGPVLTEADQLENMFLPGSTAGTTLAAFQSIVNEAAGASGISVLRMQPLPAEEAKGLSPYRLAVDATGSLEQVQSFLAGVESMLPMVIVTGLEIRPGSTDGAEVESYPSENLAVSLRLEAYSWRAVP